MEIRLCWYQNMNESMWTYDLTNDLMVELETIIALATRICIVKTNLHELNPMSEQVFNGFINDK